uniref:BTB domain-containing protein n=1 Tax=Panagrolaimus sp. JU765 TaxID=591449 RepID=A0AC34R3S1_9BILA
MFSTSFRAMFQLEKNIKEVIIKGFQPSTVKAAIDYMYSRRFDNELEMDTKLELLKFFVKYGLNDKDVIENWFKTNLSLENVCYIATYCYKNDISAIVRDCLFLLASNIDKLAGLNNYGTLSIGVIKMSMTLAKHL